jgi:hypothetical protein
MSATVAKFIVVFEEEFGALITQRKALNMGAKKILMIVGDFVEDYER